MPSRAPSRCTDPTCSDMATSGGRCVEHQRPAWQGRTSSQERYGLSGSAQQTLHQRILRRDNYCCYLCGEPATEVDHVIPIHKGGAKTDPANLAAACSACHSAKTKRENAERRRTRRSRARSAS